MSERTVKGKKSVEQTLDGEKVLLNYEWKYRLDIENNEVLNLDKTSTSRSLVTQEIKRTWPPFIGGWTQEDTQGVAEWEKLKNSKATSPGGKPLAYEDDEGRKFIVISETFNGENGSIQTVFDKKYFNSNELLAGTGFKPDSIENWDNVHFELSKYKNNKQSNPFAN